jgi:carboxypeptidase Taq
MPDLEQQIARGEFEGLFRWLRENVHGLGAKISVKALMKEATGQPLSAAALLRYLEHKYLEQPI